MTRPVKALDDVEEIDGEVEVVVRPATGTTPRAPDVLDVIAALPPGSRSKQDIDRQLRDERASWTGVADAYVDACCLIYLVEGEAS